MFREVARVLAGVGRFLFTDAGVLTGAISSDEATQRSAYGFTTFVAPGFTERLLAEAGFRVIETEDRTGSVLQNAMGRLAARIGHRGDLEQLEGATEFARQQHYLETVIALTRRGALSRIMYLAESRAA